MNEQKCDAIIIDEQANGPMGLKSAAKAISEFGKIQTANNFSEYAKAKESLESVDIIFLAYELGFESVTEFVTNNKKETFSQDAAFVVVVKPEDQKKISVTANLTSGCDGFLFSPYSVDALKDIVKLAEKVKKIRMADRMKGSIGIHVKEVLGLVDKYAARFAMGRSSALAKKQLVEACDISLTYDAELKEIYYEQLLHIAPELPVPKPMRKHRSKTITS